MKIVKKIGNIVTVFALFFLVRRMMTFDIAWRELLTSEHILVLVLCLVLCTLQVLLNCWPWQRLVGVITEAEDILKHNRGLLVLLYTKSNILKYIPGNVFQYIGRNELAISLGLDHVNVATATVAEIFLATLAALIISAVLIGPFTIEYLVSHASQIILLGIVMLVVLCVLGVVIYGHWKDKVLAYLVQYQNVLKSRTSVKSLLFCFGFYCFTFFWCGTMFFAVMIICGDLDWNAASVRILMGSFILSWLAGYITPGSPGGVGVRELILTSSIVGSGIAPETVVMTASLIYRLINILGDLLAFAVAFLAFRLPVPRKNR